MGKWLSCGYEPVVDETVRRFEDELIRENLPLILSSFGRILSTPRHFFCRPSSAFLSCPYVFGGGGPIPLGVLVSLWRRGELVFDCPACVGLVYGFGVAGSVLSGSGTVQGICIVCRRWQSEPRKIGESILAVGTVLAAIRLESLIQTEENPRFECSEGIVDESLPKQVIAPAVEPVDVVGLIQELKTSSDGLPGEPHE
jgi:hypothetical protein